MSGNAPMAYDRNYAWIPEERNPSKLRAHKFENGKWLPLAYVKTVPWPEKFPLPKEDR